MTLILHQYRRSPFSEKVRLMLGFKRLDWVGVEIPVINPKPDVVALTGGYRKTPFLQIGADIYCDSALIARLLERMQPTPTLYPESAPLAPLLAQWADSTLFWAAVPWAAQPAGAAALFAGMPPAAMKAFALDRASFTAGMKRLTPADAALQLRQHLAAFEAQLRDGRSYLFGEQASVADFSAAHPLWFIRLAEPVAGILAPYTRVAAWLDRVLAIGHGSHMYLDSTQAVEIAARLAPQAAVSVLPGQGFEAGMAVTAAATDYGSDPVAGQLVGLDDEEIVLQREDPRAGVLHVHFPRAGFQLRQEKE